MTLFFEKKVRLMNESRVGQGWYVDPKRYFIMLIFMYYAF